VASHAFSYKKNKTNSLTNTKMKNLTYTFKDWVCREIEFVERLLKLLDL